LVWFWPARLIDRKKTISYATVDAMSNPLNPAAKEKLEKLIARIDSPHEGERVNAVSMACALLRQHGLAMRDLPRIFGDVHEPVHVIFDGSGYDREVTRRKAAEESLSLVKAERNHLQALNERWLRQLDKIRSELAAAKAELAVAKDWGAPIVSNASLPPSGGAKKKSSERRRPTQRLSPHA
jgi:hypothetical protein